MVLSCSPVRLCVRPKTLLMQYLAHLHQTYINVALRDRGERFTIWDQKVKVQGHGGINYAGNSSVWAC